MWLRHVRKANQEDVHDLTGKLPRNYSLYWSIWYPKMQVNSYYHCVLKLAMCFFSFEGLANFLCSFFYFTKWNLRFLLTNNLCFTVEFVVNYLHFYSCCVSSMCFSKSRYNCRKQGTIWLHRGKQSFTLMADLECMCTFSI